MASRKGPRKVYCRAYALILLSFLCVHCDSGDPLEEVHGYQLAGRHDAAIEILRALIDDGTRDPEVLYLYGVSQRVVGRPGLAIASLAEARRFEGWEVKAGVELAAAAHNARAWPTAIEAATAVIEREPSNAYAYAVRAEALIESRSDPEQALRDVDRVIELEPDNIAMRLGRVTLLLSLDRIDEAREILEEIEGLATPESFSEDERAGFCIARATFRRESGDADGATAAFDECLENYPMAPHVVGALLEHHDGMGNRERGNEILTGLVESLPLEFIPRAQLARRLHAMGERERAYALLAEGGELAHPLPAAYALSTLAELYADNGRFAEAAEVFGRVRTLEGDQGPQRILAHAELLALAGEKEQALELAKELGDHIYRHLVYAAVSETERDAAAALEHLERALVEWPDNAAAQYYAARAAERIGDFPRAMDAYRNSIRAGADQTDAGVQLALLYRAAGRYREAYVAVNHHIRKNPGDWDAELLGVELAGRMDPNTLQAALAGLPSATPWGRVAASLADLAAESGGPDAAVALLRGHRRIDLRDPRDAPAIEALVRHLRAAGHDAEALSIAADLVGRFPEVAQVQWIRSLASDDEASRLALDRALRLDPTLEAARLAHARRVVRAGDLDAGLATMDAVASNSPEVLLEVAGLLSGAGRQDEAEARLESLLWERPHHGEAARNTALLRLARGAGAEARTLDLAERGVRFGGGAEAYEVLEQVFEARGEPARASEAREKALMESGR